jgi:hypothetical protein
LIRVLLRVLPIFVFGLFFSALALSQSKAAPPLAAKPAPEAAAQGPSDSIAKSLPVSVSYSQLIKCYPELRNEAWSRKVDLNELKEEIDRNFLTTQSLLRQREVILKDPQTEVSKRLRLAARESKAKKKNYDYYLTLEKLDAKGGGTPLDLPAQQRVNPKQKDLNGYFLNQEVLQDETSFFDTKLRGVTASYKKNFKDISEIELKDSQSSRRLFCENKKDLGIVCTCFPK